jgi:hypothetical protein
LGARHHGLGRPVHRLRRGCGLPVHRGPRYVLGPPSGKYGPSCDIGRLGPDLRGTAEDNVVDGTATYPSPSDELRQHLCRKIDGVPARERTTSPAVRGADGINYNCLPLPVPLGYPWHSVDHADADDAPDDIGHTGREHTYDHLPEGAADGRAARRLRKQDADH